MEARVCAGLALAAAYWRDDATNDEPPGAEQLLEQAAVRAALAARCTGRHPLPQRQRR